MGLENLPTATIKITVSKAEKVSERLNRVSMRLDEVGKGDYAEIVSDDEIMLKAAPKMIKSIGKAAFIKSWIGDDGYFHTLVEKK